MRKITLMAIMLLVVVALPSWAKESRTKETPRAERACPPDEAARPAETAAVPKAPRNIQAQDDGCMRCGFLWDLWEGSLGTNYELTYLVKASSCSYKYNCPIY